MPANEKSIENPWNNSVAVQVVFGPADSLVEYIEIAKGIQALDFEGYVGIAQKWPYLVKTVKQQFAKEE